MSFSLVVWDIDGMRCLNLLAFIILCSPISLFADKTTFPYKDSGPDAAKPVSCNVPSFYSATDTGTLYVCQNGTFVLIGESGGSSSLINARDYATFQLALAACGTSCEIYIPAGTYSFGTPSASA